MTLADKVRAYRALSEMMAEEWEFSFIYPLIGLMGDLSADYEFFSREEMKLVSRVVRTAFNQRRKQLGKVLGQMFGKAETASAFENLNIPMEIRPDKLEVADFVAIARQLQSQEDKKNG